MYRLSPTQVLPRQRVDETLSALPLSFVHSPLVVGMAPLVLGRGGRIGRALRSTVLPEGLRHTR